jgi:hypothetical protein
VVAAAGTVVVAVTGLAAAVRGRPLRHDGNDEH